ARRAVEGRLVAFDVDSERRLRAGLQLPLRLKASRDALAALLRVNADRHLAGGERRVEGGRVRPAALNVNDGVAGDDGRLSCAVGIKGRAYESRERDFDVAEVGHWLRLPPGFGVPDAARRRRLG